MTRSIWGQAKCKYNFPHFTNGCLLRMISQLRTGSRKQQAVSVNDNTSSFNQLLKEKNIPNLVLMSSFMHPILVPGSCTDGKRWEYGWDKSQDG